MQYLFCVFFFHSLFMLLLSHIYVVVVLLWSRRLGSNLRIVQYGDHSSCWRVSVHLSLTMDSSAFVLLLFSSAIVGAVAAAAAACLWWTDVDSVCNVTSNEHIFGGMTFELNLPNRKLHGGPHALNVNCTWMCVLCIVINCGIYLFSVRWFVGHSLFFAFNFAGRLCFVILNNQWLQGCSNAYTKTCYERLSIIYLFINSFNFMFCLDNSTAMQFAMDINWDTMLKHKAIRFWIPRRSEWQRRRIHSFSTFILIMEIGR